MNILKSLYFAAAAIAALSATAAHATVVGSAGTDTGGQTFTLSTSDVRGGVLETGNINNGAIATEPSGANGYWLAGEPTSLGGSAVVTFGGNGVSDVSFIWGTPDSYNTLVVTQANGATTDFTSANYSTLGLTSGQNDVNFSETGSAIVSLTFVSTSAAFEAANFETTPVPEPATVALLGLGFLGFVAMRRKSNNNA